MKITYVTEDTGLWGGILVVFQQLELLSEMGFEAFLTTTSDMPDWYPLKVPLHRIERLDPSLIPSVDIAVATSWKTIESVANSKNWITIHLCQGYEGGIKEYRELKNAIDKAYSLIPNKLTVSPNLTNFLKERFNSKVYYIGQMFDRNIFFPANIPAKDKYLPLTKSFIKHLSFSKTDQKIDFSTFNILLIGPYEADVKNIKSALKGIKLAKEAMKTPIRLTRVSPIPFSEEEKAILKSDVYHYHVPHPLMGEIYRSADLLISVSKEVEGFGLPALEAMACGIPTILSKIPSYTSFDEQLDYAYFVEPQDIRAIAEGILEIYKNRTLRDLLSKRGVEVSNNFTKEKVVERFKFAFEEIVKKNKLEKTKNCWNLYHLSKKDKEIKYWWDSPIIIKHCQRLVTGDPNTNFHQFLKNEFVEFPLDKGLSICSGSGEFERGLIEHGICKTIDAYEIAEDRVKEGILTAKESGYKINFFIEDVNYAKFKPNHYDIFFSWSALHHIENLEGVCRNAWEALKFRGLLVAQEYIGPNQLQWTDSQLDLANKILSIIPDTLKKDPATGIVLSHIERPSLEQLNHTDPSEAIRSSEIIETINKFFKIKTIKYFGGSLYNCLFNAIIYNFSHSDEKDIALIEMILFLEETLIQRGILDNDYAVIIAEKA